MSIASKMAKLFTCLDGSSQLGHGIVLIFAHVGIPYEILADQEDNFTSNSYQNYTKCFTSISYKQAPTILKRTDSCIVLIKL